MVYNERPCCVDDCNNWINNPDVCVKCMEESFECDLESNIDINEDI